MTCTLPGSPDANCHGVDPSMRVSKMAGGLTFFPNISTYPKDSESYFFTRVPIRTNTCSAALFGPLSFVIKLSKKGLKHTPTCSASGIEQRLWPSNQ